jgi:predicted nucleotidyltransferase component of viral defense system
MKRRNPTNVAASVRWRLLAVSKERGEDFTLTLMNYAAERFLYRMSRSTWRDQFVLKGAMLLAVRIGEAYRPTRDLDLLGTGEATETAVEAAVRDIASTAVEEDGVSFDVGSVQVHATREDNRYGGIRAALRARLAEARIHVRIDVGFGDAITPATVELELPTLLPDMPAPSVLTYPIETIVAEKVEAMVDLGMLNSRMKDFTDVAMAARRVAFDGNTLVAALRATFRRRRTPLPETGIVPLSEEFVQDARVQANWKAFATKNRPRDFDSLAEVINVLRSFLLPPIQCARTGEPFAARWNPGGPWT